ncbi:MAG TPA: hypothetical protein DIT89_16745 [Planctomycetaceae bacterium]|nr:hypothetical protein [Planctomycetaceae bacterium]
MRTGPGMLLLLILLSVPGCTIDGAEPAEMSGLQSAEVHPVTSSGNSFHKAGRSIKRALDKRHLADRTAVYTGLGGADTPLTAAADLGVLRYSSDSIEHRLALRGMVGTGDSDLLAGLDTGLRFQLPATITPFVGAGLFGGMSLLKRPAEDDNVDNDNDDSIDEDGETKNHFYFALYPEIGVSWWLTSKTRATFSIQRHISTAGRDLDYTFFGLSFARLQQPDTDTPRRRPVQESPPLTDPDFTEHLQQQQSADTPDLPNTIPDSTEVSEPTDSSAEGVSTYDSEQAQP